MPGGFYALLLRHLLRESNRRRRFNSRRRRSISGPPYHHFHARYARRFARRRHGSGRFHGQGNRRSAGHANGVAPLPVPSAPLAQQALGADENADLAPTALPPGFWCSAHGWVICPLHEHSPVVGVDAVGQSPTSIFDFGSTSAAVVHANAVAPHLPSPTPASPPSSPRASARRRVIALGVPLRSSPSPPPSNSRAGRAGTWSPAALRLGNGVSNGVAPGTHLPGGSSDEEGRGGSSARRR